MPVFSDHCPACAKQKHQNHPRYPPPPPRKRVRQKAFLFLFLSSFFLFSLPLWPPSLPARAVRWAGSKCCYYLMGASCCLKGESRRSEDLRTTTLICSCFVSLEPMTALTSGKSCRWDEDAFRSTIGGTAGLNLFWIQVASLIVLQTMEVMLRTSWIMNESFVLSLSGRTGR